LPSLGLLSWLAFVTTVFAESQPLMRTSLQPRSVVVGQAVTLEVDVFVPTYFTGAPRFPQLEVKDAVVVFLDTGGQNLTESIGGVDYAGQRRSYLIYPQRPGDFEVPAFEVKVRYAINAQPSPRTPVSARSRRFVASIPEAARSLEHFVATPSFELSGTTDRPLEDLKVGDTLTRTITMTATEAFAMMLPPLSFPHVDGLGVYPAPPRVTDTWGERGETRVGKRVESVTYALQKEGHYRLPAIDVDWWDTSARKVRHATVPETDFTVAANPNLKAEIPLPEDPSEKRPPPDPWRPLREAVRRFGPFALVAVFALAVLFRLFQPRIRAWRSRNQRRRKEKEASSAAYLERVRQAAGAGPAARLAATYRFLDRSREGAGAAARLDRFAQESGDAALTQLADELVESALATGQGAGAGGHAQAFVEALVRAARQPKAAGEVPEGLGPLNPR
jgi:hypothetical protein